MNLKDRMTHDEFNKLKNDIKYEYYAELYEYCKHLNEQNERQYLSLKLREKFINELKKIIITIIENMKGGE